MPTTAPKTPITTRITRLAPTSALVAAWRALLAAAVHRGGGVLVLPKTSTRPPRTRAIRVLEPPPALEGVPHVQPPEPFSELAWSGIGPDGRRTRCVILAPANWDGFEIWITAGRGDGVVTPIQRVRSLRVARIVAHGLRAKWGAQRRRAASPARRADAGQIDDTTRPPVRADVEPDRVRP